MEYQGAINLVNKQLSVFLKRNRNNYCFASIINGFCLGISGTYDEWNIKRSKKKVINKEDIYKIQYKVLKYRKGAKGRIDDPLWEMVLKGNYEQVIEFLGGK